MAVRGSTPGPLFRLQNGHSLTREIFTSMVRVQALSSLGCDSSLYAGHSFSCRAGSRRLCDKNARQVGEFGLLPLCEDASSDLVGDISAVGGPGSLIGESGICCYHPEYMYIILLYSCYHAMICVWLLYAVLYISFCNGVRYVDELLLGIARARGIV